LEIAQKPYNDVNKTLGDLCFFNGKTVVLEIKTPEEEFPLYDSQKMALRVFVHNIGTNTWSEVNHVYIEKNSTLGDLREEIAAKFGIPADQQVICKESYNKLNSSILLGDNLILRMHHSIFEGIKVWVEQRYENMRNEDYKVDINRLNLDQLQKIQWPRSFEEISRVKNMMEIKFGDPDSAEYKYSLKVSRTMLMRDLKVLIGEKLGIAPDEFKVMKLYTAMKYEIRNENGKLSEVHITSGDKLYIEKGKPLGPNESPFRFYYYSYTGEGVVEIKELFTLPLNNGMTVAEAKVAFFEYYKKCITEDQECKFKDVELISPENLRIRHLYSKYPSTILFDTQLMKEASRGVMSSIELAIQKLPSGEMEPKMSKENIIVFMQQFIPSKFEFGDRFELCISSDDDLDDLRARLNQRCGCENIALAEAERYEIISLLALDNLDWHEPKENKEKISLRESRSSYKTKVKILSPKDGYIIIFKDCKEPEKKITEDEKKAIREKERKK